MKNFTHLLTRFACIIALLAFTTANAAVPESSDPDETGTITFGSATGSVKIDTKEFTGNDNKNNSWSIITEIALSSFTQSTTYSQIGAAKKPATSITAKMAPSNNIIITSFEAKFGGFSGTKGDVTLSVGGTTVATGVLNATNDVTVTAIEIEAAASPSKPLVISITGIDKGVKVYSITYTYHIDNSAPLETTVTFEEESYTFYEGDTESRISATANSEGAITYTSSNEDVLMIDATTGEIMAIGVGTATITATAAAVGAYPAASATVEVNVMPVPALEYKLLVVKMNSEEEDVYYAMSCISSTNNALDAVRVDVKDGKVLLTEANDNLLWQIDKAKGYIKSKGNGEYLNMPKTDKTYLETSTDACEWTKSTAGYWIKGTRTFFYGNGAFKAFATNNIGKSGYSQAAVEMSYTISVPVTIGETGFKTLYYSNLNLQVPEGVSAYTYAADGENLMALNLENDFYTDVIPAGTAVVLYTENPGTYKFEAVDGSYDAIDPMFNSLCGSDDNTTITNNDCSFYVLGKGSQGLAWYIASEEGSTVSNNAHSAYLKLSYEDAAGIRYFALGIGNNTTGISQAKSEAISNIVYDLQGRRVNNAAHGLYIVNGKKVVKYGQENETSNM